MFDASSRGCSPHGEKRLMSIKPKLFKASAAVKAWLVRLLTYPSISRQRLLGFLTSHLRFTTQKKNHTQGEARRGKARPGLARQGKEY